MPQSTTCFSSLMDELEANPGLARLHYSLRASAARIDSPNSLRTGIHSRGYLPHVKREGASYFVTFRLSDSLPQNVLLDFKRQQAERVRSLETLKPAAREDIDRELKRQIERYLDLGAGECYLRQPAIAQMVADALIYFQNQQYVLDEWVVMPNHVHLIIWPIPNYTLSEILQSRKRHTARQANVLLGRTGETFWQHESYDHWIRDDDEKLRLRRYIRNNPVKARLCRSPEEWRWSSAFCNKQRTDYQIRDSTEW